MTRIVRKYLRHSTLSKALLQQAPIACMTFEQRRRSRQQVTLDNGETIHLFLERGQLLIPDDVLVADDGGLIVVKAQVEALVRVTGHHPTDLCRAAYHLGNRHVTVEVADGYLQLEHDPVLVDMLHRLGVQTTMVEQPFNPEHGAYGGGHKHGHDETFDEDYALAQAAYHAHDHAHLHDHDHDHSHDHNHSHHQSPGRAHTHEHAPAEHDASDHPNTLTSQHGQ